MCHDNNSRIFALPELACQSQDIKQKAHFEENLNIFKVYKFGNTDQLWKNEPFFRNPSCLYR